MDQEEVSSTWPGWIVVRVSGRCSHRSLKLGDQIANTVVRKPLRASVGLMLETHEIHGAADFFLVYNTTCGVVNYRFEYSISDQRQASGTIGRAGVTNRIDLC